MLEGGCGIGQYVSYYSRRGRYVVGLDFAFDAVAKLHTRSNDFPLCVGDVSKLPFRDITFDLYYSGGVVEHFETGPQEALREAWRVLKPGGIFLVSVPYFSPLRRFISRFRTDDWRKVSETKPDADEKAATRRFFQYAFKPTEFKLLLSEAGFTVVKIQGYSILWGLYELPLFALLPKYFESRAAAAPTQTQTVIPEPDSAPLTDAKPARASFLKRLAVDEDDSVLIIGKAVKALRWACANMMMYVCVRKSIMASE